jgi:hypothetical protein
MDRLDELFAIREIESLLVRYARGIDRFDREMMRSAFLEEATTDHPPFHVGRAWEFIDSQLASIGDSVQYSHLIGSIAIEVRDNEARSEATFWSWVRLAEAQGSEYFVAGRYLDKLKKVDLGWKISERVVVQDLVRMVPITGPIRHEGAHGGVRSSDDPVYSILWVP